MHLLLLVAGLVSADLVVKNHVIIDSPITVRTLTVEPGGFLDVREGAEITFEDFPLDTVADPDQLGHGLLVYGKLRARGGYVEPYARASAELVAGAVFVPLAVPASWQVGHRLYFPDTRQPDHQFNPAGKTVLHEVRAIKQIKADGVVLDQPLAYHHLGARDADGNIVFLPVIANLTRSIVFRSANPNGVRAHCFFNERADVRIEGVAFLDMGRTTGAPIDDTKRDAKGNVLKVGTNPKGRYPVHFHHYMGPEPDPARDYQFVCRNNVVWSQAPLGRWGIVVHQAHYGLIDQNVVVTCAGAGIVTEDGNETENIFQRNYVAHVTGEGRPDARPNEIGFEGSAYWFRGGNNSVRDNYAYSAKDGFAYYPRFAPIFKYPSVPGGMADTLLDPCRTPIRSFLDNEVCSCQVGFAPWWIGVINRTPVEGIAHSVIDGLRCYHVRACVSAYESGRFRYVDPVFFGDKKLSNDNSSGWGASDYVQWQCSIEGGRIEGYNSGVRAPSIADRLDASGTNPGLFVVRDTHLRCRTNVTVPIPWHNATGLGLPPLTVHLDSVGFHSLVGSADQRHVRLGVRISEFTNYPQWVNVWYHGPESLNLQFFGKNQDPLSILPATAQGGRIQGAPVALPNQEAWAIYGLSGGGEITPVDAVLTDPAVDGRMRLMSPSPYICPIPDQVVQPGQAWEYRLRAYDPTLGEIDYRLKEGPAGMGIENRSGKLNWQAPLDGTHPVTVEAVDVDTGEADEKSFTLGVRMPSG